MALLGLLFSSVITLNFVYQEVAARTDVEVHEQTTEEFVNDYED